MHYNEDIASIEYRGHDEGTFRIRYRVTALCNYSCAFCVQGSREEHIRAAREEGNRVRQEITDALVSFIETELRGYKAITIDLIGGEVTVLKQFPSIMEQLIDCDYPGNLTIHITTNLSLSKERLVEMCSLFDGKRNRFLTLSASYYRDYTTVEEFVDKIEAMAKGRVTRRRDKLGYVMGRLRWRVPRLREKLQISVGFPILDDESYAEYLDFKEKYLGILAGVDPIVIRGYPVDLSNEVKERLRSSGGRRVKVAFKDGTIAFYRNIQQVALELDDVERFCPDGFVCDAGIDNISIDVDGEVYRCPVIPRDEAMRLGNIHDGFQRLREPRLCEANHCSCNVYRHIFKPI